MAENTTIKFLYGKKDGIPAQIDGGAIEGSDFVVTSDTDELVFVDSAKNIKPIKSRTENTHKLVGTAIGALAEGSTIDPGITLDQFIAMICQKRIAATYTAPSVAIARTAGSAVGNVEVGTEIKLSARGTFTKNDAGTLSSIEIIETVNDSSSGTNVATANTVATSASSPVTITDHVATVPTGSVVFSAKATYAQGDVKNDNLGDASPTGRIEAGSKTTTSNLTFTGVRKYWYGAGTGTAAFADSAAVRAIPSSGLAAKKGTIIKITFSVGDQYAVFAYPKSVGVASKVRYEEGNDDSMLGSFNRAEIDVEGANGYGAVTYYVYTYQMASPAEAGMNFTVTI